MTYLAAIIVFIILIALIVGLMFGPLWLKREKPGKSGFYYGGEGLRENYGPPPGAYRALGHEELDYRGWPEAPLEFTANTASALSHMIERSA